MATQITPTTVSKPLSDFTKIGYNIYLYTPPSYTASSPLVLLFAWNAAAAKHIAKYTASYQKLFPSARIVLIRCDTPDMFRSIESYTKLLRPAVDVVREHEKAGGEVLVHSFSNGGANQVTEFSRAWKTIVGGLFPMRVHILDSSPGKGDWKRSHAAISAGLPRSLFWKVFGSALVHLLLACTWVFWTAQRKENDMVVMCRNMNDEGLFDTRVPRVYLYSKADEMIGWEEVEEHAALAKEKGWDVELVRFERSAHVGHVREDEKKYWGAVMEAWKRGPRGA